MTGMPARLVLAAALAVAAAGPAGAVEVVIFKSGEQPGVRAVVDALRRAGAAHNFNEFDLAGNRTQGERIAAGLRGRTLVMVAVGLLAAEVVRVAMPEAPLVYCMVPDPARAGLVDVPRVGGVAAGVPVKNQLAAFRLVNPRGVRIGVLHGPETAGAIDEAQKAARLVRVALVPRSVASDREVPQALRELLGGADPVDAVWLMGDPLLTGEQTRRLVLSEALKAGRPVYAYSDTLIAEGALVSDGPDPASVGEQMAELVGRLAAGERGPLDLLVPRAELVINRKIAGKLKIDIPADALSVASRVF
jgi:putative tryptophan/tyrosine transport system substrate-binding protein